MGNRDAMKIKEVQEDAKQLGGSGFTGLTR